MKLKLIFPSSKYGVAILKFPVALLKNGYMGVPLALPTIAALTPAGIEVSILDENVDVIDFDEKVDLVGISSNVASVNRAYEIADEFRARGVKVILGGVHVSAFPEEAAAHADTVVVGEVEETWGDILSDFRKNKLNNIYRCKKPPDLKSSPIPAWNLVNTKSYNYFSVQASRGCSCGCDYCSVTRLFGPECRYKPIANVIKEIELFKKINRHKLILLTDDNIFSNPKYAKELFRAIIPLKVRWYGQMPITIARDEELLELMRASGCYQLSIGFESISQTSLKAMSKDNVNKVDEYETAIAKIHSYNIPIIGLFIVNTEYDDEDSFTKIIRFVNDNNIPYSVFSILMPFPGTRLFQRLEKEGRIIHRDWRKYTSEYVTFLPKHTSPQVLQQGFYRILQEVYSYESIYNRLSGLWKKGLFAGQRINNLRNFGLLTITVLSLLLSGKFKHISFLLKCLTKVGRSFLPLVIVNIALHDYSVEVPLRTRE